MLNFVCKWNFCIPSEEIDARFLVMQRDVIGAAGTCYRVIKACVTIILLAMFRIFTHGNSDQRNR